MATLSEHPAATSRSGGLERYPGAPAHPAGPHLSHNYGNRLALDNLSFAVQPAEIFGLLGPNGSGKTTLFRILSTLMVPSGGEARIQGFDVAREPNQARQQTGIVFQARSLDLKLTVAENLKHQGHLYGLRGEALKIRSDEVLRRVGLSDRAREYRRNAFRRHATAGRAGQGPHPFAGGSAAGRAIYRPRSRRAP